MLRGVKWRMVVSWLKRCWPLTRTQAWTLLVGGREGWMQQEHHPRRRRDAGQVVAEAAGANGARTDSWEIVRGINSFLLRVLHFLCWLTPSWGWRQLLAAGGGRALIILPDLRASLTALCGSPGCDTTAAGGISWEFHLTGMKGCLLGLAN